MGAPAKRRAFVNRSVVQRVLSSLAFRRSREASAAIVDDPHSLRGLTESVRDRGYEQGALEPVSNRIDAALNLLDDRAELLETMPRDLAHDEPAPATLAPASAARHRLIVAAMHYLARKDDVIPDASRGGDLDDVVVVREVLGSAEGDLAPYLEEPPSPTRPARDSHGAPDTDGAGRQSA